MLINGRTSAVERKFNPMNDKKLSEKISQIIDYSGIMLIGVFCMGYVSFKRSFAELSISLPFLDFPVFIGEILTIICGVLFFSKHVLLSPPQTARKRHYVFAAYFLFILIKAFYGYAVWGPLAFRHAALFYYPVLGIFVSSFYRSDYFNTEKRLWLPILIIATFFIGYYDRYWLVTYFLLAFIVLRTQPYQKARVLLLLGLLVVCPYRLFFQTARMMVVGNIVSGLYIFLALSWILRISFRYKLIFFTFLFCFLTVAFLKTPYNYAVKTIVDIKTILREFQRCDHLIENKKDSFRMKSSGCVKVYNPDKVNFLRRQRKEIVSLRNLVETINPSTKREKTKIFQPDFEIAGDRETSEYFIQRLPEALKNFLTTKKTPPEINPLVNRPEADRMASAMSNAIFRLLIWRDMIHDLSAHKPFFGFDFGKPLRSFSLEALSLGRTEWSRDGWIAPHNSYLHIIYRAGIIGVLFILGIIGFLIRMIKDFIKMRSISGILLCAIIINWFTAANFLLIFELPYTAIPIWSIYGLTVAYYQQQMKKCNLTQQ